MAREAAASRGSWLSPELGRPRVTEAPGEAAWASSAVRRTIVCLVSASAAGGILLVDPVGADPFHLLRSVFGHATAVVLAALLAIALARYGRAIVPVTWVHAFVLAFVAANVVSAVLSESPYVAFFGETEHYTGLTFIVEMLVLYCAIAVSFRRAADWGWLAVSVAAAGVLSVLYAIAQRHGVDPISLGAGSSGAAGTFGDAETLGRYLATLFGVALGVAVFGSPSASRAARVAAGCVALGALVTAATHAAAASLLGFAAALVTTPFILFALRRTDREAIDRHLVQALVVLTIVTGAVTATAPLATRVRVAIAGIDVRDRTLVYEGAIAAAADRPIFGFGPDSFAVAYPYYRQPGAPPIAAGAPRSAGAWPIDTAVTLGLAGLVTLLLLLAATTRALWRNGIRRAPELAAPALLASVAFWTHGLVAPSSLALDWCPWAVFATAAVLDAAPLATAHAPPPRRLPALAAIVAVVVALTVLVLSGASVVDSDRALRAARVALETGHADLALRAAEAAVREDPGRAEPWGWLGRARELAGDPAAASDAYAAAAARRPSGARYWIDLARARAEQLVGGAATSPDMVLAVARRAVAAEPASAEANGVLAEVAGLTGAYDLALDAAARARLLDPGRADYERAAVSAALATDPRDGANALRALVAVSDSATLRLGLAKLALERSDTPAARREASRALELDPQNDEARAILGQIGGPDPDAAP